MLSRTGVQLLTKVPGAAADDVLKKATNPLRRFVLETDCQG